MTTSKMPNDTFGPKTAQNHRGSGILAQKCPKIRHFKLQNRPKQVKMPSNPPWKNDPSDPSELLHAKFSQKFAILK